METPVALRVGVGAEESGRARTCAVLRRALRLTHGRRRRRRRERRGRRGPRRQTASETARQEGSAHGRTTGRRGKLLFGDTAASHPIPWLAITSMGNVISHDSPSPDGHGRVEAAFVYRTTSHATSLPVFPVFPAGLFQVRVRRAKW